MVMPVSPMNSGNGGFGFGGDWAWIILLLVLCGGWNNGFGGGFGGGDIYPWMNQSNQINGGFRDQMLNSGITGIQNSITSGFGDVQNALCGGFAGVNASINGAQNAVSQQLFSNQIADMQNSFALQSQLAQCCCDNRAAIADTKYALATEACATRTADAQNTNAVLNAMNSGIQSIKDQLCADKIESKNDLIAQLRSELMYARGQASQDVQTAAIQAGQRALANEVEQYVLPTPRPAYIVQNPNCCTQNYGCGCGV
jgi:hypothetical protein